MQAAATRMATGGHAVGRLIIWSPPICGEAVSPVRRVAERDLSLAERPERGPRLIIAEERIEIDAAGLSSERAGAA